MITMPKVSIEYFAILRERAGCSREDLTTDAATLGELYGELQRRHSFPAMGQVKAAINDEFRDLQSPLSDGDRIVFIPPVAGG